MIITENNCLPGGIPWIDVTESALNYGTVSLKDGTIGYIISTDSRFADVVNLQTARAWKSPEGTLVFTSIRW